jgi:hypothetical protein
MPNKYIGRFAIDPTDPNIAYVCYGGFGLAAGEHVWKTTNLMTGTPTWTASGSGLPDVPVNSFVIDPLFPTTLFAGTDVGVYISTNTGATWSPFTTGMPVVTIFDMALQPTSRILRVATHGRGMWQRQIDPSVPVEISLVGAEIIDGHPRMTWYASAESRQGLTLYRRAVPATSCGSTRCRPTRRAGSPTTTWRPRRDAATSTASASWTTATRCSRATSGSMCRRRRRSSR